MKDSTYVWIKFGWQVKDLCALKIYQIIFDKDSTDWGIDAFIKDLEQNYNL